MNTHSERSTQLQTQLVGFMDSYVYPAEHVYRAWVDNAQERWSVPPIMEELKSKARQAGLWNLWRPKALGGRLSHREFAPLAEVMGRSLIGPEVFNCSAPDTENMELLLRHGNAEQQAQWLEPLFNGEIRSAFCLTEPDVASSDGANIQCSISRDGDEYVIKGRKWWASGALDPRCAVYLVMGKSQPDAAREQQHSVLLVPADAAGVVKVRALSVFGSDDAPLGHAEINFDQVRVPVGNLIAEQGRGLAISEDRLSCGHIHSSMRLIGCAQRALEMMCQRAASRQVQGHALAERGTVREDIAKSWCEINQTRVLTLAAAAALDEHGSVGARQQISAVKIVTPQMAQTVIDRAIQIHGARGVSQDTFLAAAWAHARTSRLCNGPDQVQLSSLGEQLVAQYAND